MEDDRITTLNSDMYADSIPAFREVIDKIMKDEALGGIDSEHQPEVWYRGQQRKHWPLVPKIRRITQEAWQMGNDAREEFSLHAATLHYGFPLPANEWDMYFLMQHYGAPTRLLDWTESPMAALYFALRDNPGLYDSAVWVLDPGELNEISMKDATIIAPSAVGVDPKRVKAISGWLPKLYAVTPKSRRAKYPVAVFPSDVAWRMNGQRSRFTVHGDEKYGFRRFTKGKNPPLRRIVIPAHAARAMLAEVKNYGIDETVLFPDLEGLGRALTTKYSDFTQGYNLAEPSPYDSVYTRLCPSLH